MKDKLKARWSLKGAARDFHLSYGLSFPCMLM